MSGLLVDAFVTSVMCVFRRGCGFGFGGFVWCDFCFGGVCLFGGICALSGLLRVVCFGLGVVVILSSWVVCIACDLCLDIACGACAGWFGLLFGCWFVWLLDFVIVVFVLIVGFLI